MNKKRSLMVLGAGAVSLAMVLTACSSGGAGDSDEGAAASYPDRPITILQPFAAGGGTDAVARALAEGLSEELSTPVNVEVRTGGGGAVGFTAMADAEPDGYTLGIMTVEATTLHHLGQTTFTPDQLVGIAQVNADASAIIVNADAPWDTFEELMAEVESNPGTLTASGGGRGNIYDVGRAGMLLELGLPEDSIRWVSTNGSAPTLAEVLAGGIDISFNSLSEASAQLKSGDVKALATFGEERNENYPDVPTLMELGVDWTSGAWRGVAVPTETPQEIIDILADALEVVVNGDQYQEFLDTTGFGFQFRNAADFDDFITAQDELWGATVEEAGLGE